MACGAVQPVTFKVFGLLKISICTHEITGKCFRLAANSIRCATS